MNSVSHSKENDEVAHLLRSLRDRGVQIWSERGALRYKARKGILTSVDLERVRAHSNRIVALIAQSSAVQITPRDRKDMAPLTYSQLARWDHGRLAARPTIRQVASAFRLIGDLDVALLRSSITEVVRRHEALRTRISAIDGIPMQIISDSIEYEMTIKDLTHFTSEVRDRQTRCFIDDLVLRPIFVGEGPLFGVGLARLGINENVLVVVMEHIVADGESINIFIRDLFALYAHGASAESAGLSPIGIQFGDYAGWQRDSESLWLECHRKYWDRRLGQCRRLLFPTQDPRLTTAVPALGWGVVALPLGGTLQRDLRQWCRQQRTTMVMAAFAAYVAVVLRWCRESEGVFRFETDGRTHTSLQQTIGFFAAPLYVHTKLLDSDTFIDHLKRVTDEYCYAYENPDFMYQEAQTPQPDLVGSSLFNWIVQHPRREIECVTGSERKLVLSPFKFRNPVFDDLTMDSEPSVLVYDAGAELTFEIVFPRARFSIDTMRAFGLKFIAFINAMVEQSDRVVRDMPFD